MYSGDRCYFFIPRHLERTTYVPKYETFMKKCYAGEEISAAGLRPAHTLAAILCRAGRLDRTGFYHRTPFFLYGIPYKKKSVRWLKPVRSSLPALHKMAASVCAGLSPAADISSPA